MFSKFLIAASLLAPATAFAHITVGSGPAPAGKAQKITVNVNHGCNTSTEDTVKIEVEIPAGFTSVRAMPSDFGAVTVTKVGTTVTKLAWTKVDHLDFDDAYYEITFKATVPNTPYTKVPIKITQTCISAGGTPTVVHWDNSDPAEPAPNLVIVPPKLNATGWNKFVVPANTTVAPTDFGAYFGDALIVWKGTAAFSSNPNTAAQITSTAGVTALTAGLAAGDEIWVRY